MLYVRVDNGAAFPTGGPVFNRFTKSAIPTFINLNYGITQEMSKIF